MGFWNVRRGLRALGYVERGPLPTGPVSLVTHSGSVVLRAAAHPTRGSASTSRCRPARSWSPRRPTTSTTLVDHTETRVLALVLETVRDGARLRSSLRRARAAAHRGGAAAGRRLAPRRRRSSPPTPVRWRATTAAWEALCDDVAGHRVGDLAELGDTLELLASPRRPRPGTGLATVHDSGAERSLVADVAHDAGVPFADLSEARGRARGRLDSGLDAGNPLDVWGSGADTRGLFADCLRTLAADPAVGVTALTVDLVPEYDGDTSYVDAVLDVAAATDGPLVVLTGLPAALDEEAAERLRAAGVPVLEGFRQRAARPAAPARRRRPTGPRRRRPPACHRLWAAARGVRHPDPRAPLGVE